MTVDNPILERIAQLVALDADKASPSVSGEVMMAAINICSSVYGSASPQVKSIEASRKEIWASKYSEPGKFKILMDQLQGLLREVAADVRSGRVRDIQQRARGEVLGDLLTLSRESLDAGFKDVAAVLACAALEDALKRFAEANGLQVHDREMAEVVNALKSASLVPGPQGALLQGFTKIRNKTFHAQWESIDAADVRAVVGFVQEFLLSRFSA